MEFNKYSKIENLYKNEAILASDVVVTEKLHGTSVRFGWVGDTFYIGSRNNTIFTTDMSTSQADAFDGKINGEYNKDFDSYGFYGWICDHVDNIYDLPANTIFYGEFFGRGVQKGVQYFEEDKKHFAVFDVKVEDEYVDYDEAYRLATGNGFDFVPLVFRGSLTIEKAKTLIDCDSVWAKERGISSIAEGVVIKPVKETRDHYDNRVIVKFKSEKFHEKQKEPKVPKEVSPHYVAGKAYCTEARVENAIDKVRQEVNEELDMKHIPILMRLYNAEIEIDAKDEIPEDKKERKEFIRGASSEVVKFYKEWLFK